MGEKWKLLETEQKEDYEFQATTLKERYNQELAEYKKTDSYKEYSQYLLEFKAKANKDGGGNQYLSLDALLGACLSLST